MNDLIEVVDWSRAQFALTAMYHWLFVPLTIGLSLIVAIMESIYVRTKQERWKSITKFWMTLFGINFACGVATGLILEFEFGTNWSNYSWFVGDIFGAPLAIEGLFAFFLEATFVAVMFFGWKKVSRTTHLVATWLTALGVSLSAYWILVANAWMQYPVGMEFDPAQMRNIMTDFCAVAFSPVAINKFFHAVTSGWTLAAAFVVGVSCWLLLRKSNIEAAKSSIKVASWVGLIGILCTAWTGHGSAVAVAKVQPMKLAAMEGLYNGNVGQDLVGIGILNSAENIAKGEDPVKYRIDIPHGLSFLIYGNTDRFVPGINDILEGKTITASGDTVYGPSVLDRMGMGRTAVASIKLYEQYRTAYETSHSEQDSLAMVQAAATIKDNFNNFGYAYLSTPQAAVPPVGMTFYSFRIMVMAGGYLILFFALALLLCYKRQNFLTKPLACWIGLITVAVVWICSEAGWILAEVGRQPWVIQDLMPTNIGISSIQASSVQLTFWIFAALFTGLLIAEISIMVKYINSATKRDIETSNN